MTTSSTPAPASKGNTVAEGGDHDRVTMLSLNADGTPDQHAPEIIGDKAAAVVATQVQMAQQAVSALEQRAMSDTTVGDAETAKAQDPAIAAAVAEAEKTTAAAEKRAEAVVESLSRD
jgi:hypothetical protein